MNGHHQGMLIYLLDKVELSELIGNALFFRFCDSPTEELDSRTPKGRGKRGRSAAQQPSNDLSNFTETRSSVSLE